MENCRLTVHRRIAVTSPRTPHIRVVSITPQNDTVIHSCTDETATNFKASWGVCSVKPCETLLAADTVQDTAVFSYTTPT
ncbi:hypothetical protein J6590_057518 [Homalodisca vitripennis]|nr:hypothetical protein J6590_057518 [Homalodisca vitripennis]